MKNISQTISSFSITQFFLWIIGGLFFGFCILTVFKMGEDWRKFLTVGLSVPFLAIISRDLKRFFLALLILCVPINADVNFIYRGGHHGGAAGLGINLIDLPLLCLYLLWVVEAATERRSTKTTSNPALIPMLGFLLLVVVSMVNAVDIQFSIFEIVRLLKAFLIFYYLAKQVKTRLEIELVLKFLLIGLALECSIAFFQGFVGAETGLFILGESEAAMEQELDAVGAITRVWGTFGSSNIFAFYLQFLLPVPFALLFAKKVKPGKTFLLIMTLAGTITLLFTLSRGGWVGFAFSSLMILLFNFTRGRLTIGKSMIVLVLFLVLCASLIQFSDIIVSRFTSDDSNSSYIRIPMAQVALAIIKAHPFIGIGINNYTEVMRSYDPTAMRISDWFNFPVHNEFLLIAAETGILGLLAFLIFIAALFYTGYKIIKNNHELSFQTQLALGIVSGLFSFLLHCLGDFPLLSYFSLFWVLTGLLCALRNFPKESKCVTQASCLRLYNESFTS